MKQEFENLLTKYLPLVKRFSKRYLVFTVFLLFMLLCSALVVRINLLSAKEPSLDQVNSKLESIQRPKVDKQTLNRLQELQDQNIQVKTLFDQARQDPFAE